MVMVRRRWRGHRAFIQPGWRMVGPMSERAAELEAMTCRLAGHDVEVLCVPPSTDAMPAQVPLFRGGR